MSASQFVATASRTMNPFELMMQVLFGRTKIVRISYFKLIFLRIVTQLNPSNTEEEKLKPKANSEGGLCLKFEIQLKFKNI